jgi:predicted metal-dependent peptidase|tara:strand:- start:67 stop:1203 length:1137 start_codon:yes stop_codon:yes gene_type:complete
MMQDKYIALAGLLAIGDRSVRDDIPTACTNGRDERYGRAFCESLNDAELRFLILHENYHKLARHLHIYYHLYKIDPMLANMACDFWINHKLVEENKQDKFATMTGELSKGCYDDKYKNMSIVEIFNDLREEQEGNGGQGQGGGEPFDTHEWEEAQGLSDEEQKELAKDIDDVIRQGALVAGKVGSGGNRTLEEFLEPQVDWREALRDFITDTCAGGDFSTYNKPNRRYLHLDLIMPSGVSEKVEELVLAVDTSGSIGQRELTTFLSEVKSICDTVKPSRVRILYWDTEVCRDEVYEMDKLDVLPQSTKPSGGGGTMVECVPRYMAEHGIKPQATIIFTDGHLGGSWGSWTCPTLWVILDNKGTHSKVGKTLHVKSENL